MINPQRIQQWIGIYLDHIKEITPEVHVRDEEGYKFKSVDVFQKNFDLEAPNLYDMLNRAIVRNNLVVGSWFFPRKMLLIFAKENPDETRSALRLLFDESKPVGDRIDNVGAVFDGLMAARNARLGEDSNHFVDLRFMSLLLGYRYPEAHNALKPHEWKIYCKYVDEAFRLPSGTSFGGQYEKYRPYIEAIRVAITSVPEIDELRKQLTEGLDFKDEKFRWMAQDVIYVTTRTLEKADDADGAEIIPAPATTPAAAPEDGDHELATVGKRFMWEEDLQNFIVENFERIQLGEKLEIYIDPEGEPGVYMSTDSGEIDILTRDTDGNFVVIELKRDRAADQAVFQLGRYMQWVEENLAKPSGKSVRGILIAHRGNASLLASVRALRFPVRVLLYSINLNMTEL